jgi:hypothetical protein
MSDFRVTESEKGGELFFGGALTIENASEIRSRLIKTLIREDEVVVSIDPDASVDVSFLQLLCSAHVTASKLGKSLALGRSDAGNFLIAVENAGYIRKKGCARDANKTCIWVRGEHD